MTQEAAPSKRYFLRSDANELVLENRRRPDGLPLAFFLLGVAGTLAAALFEGGRPHWAAKVRIGLVLTAAVGAWLVGTLARRSTLTLQAGECWIVLRSLLGARRLHGALRDLDVIGVVGIAAPPRDFEDGPNSQRCLLLSLAGDHRLEARARGVSPDPLPASRGEGI